ncbi:hypothetical protein [Paenibacillus glycinis]|uniref:Uncharacterized protein n=1 Tax=Paenibacillus glycinis TaxID=2697035 RepID=A0ABW9XWP3_9BACL|nr:hypothetical protein [Paenibacillus glycinis]NBD27133.1 hypothetical protein [Paenibacillus glycinis]
MQNKRTVTKIAAVALMLSAFASPLAANAATAPLSNIYTAALTEAGEGWSLPDAGNVVAGKAVALVDPLALAKQYAPNTVSEWEKTLAAFDKLVKNVTLTATSAPLPENATVGQAVAVRGTAVSGTELTQANRATSKPLAISISKISDGKLQKVRDLTPEDLKAIKAMPAQAVTVTSGDITIGGDLKDADGKPATIAIQATPIDSPLLEGQFELSKAADAKDAEAIKQALSKLLGLYKAEIEQLQQAE